MLLGTLAIIRAEHAVIATERKQKTMIQSPPYRADHVGSLLRPAQLKDARAAFYQDQSISAAGLKTVEDQSIRDAVALQEELGFQVTTDGEHRRRFWHYDFLEALDGIDMVTREEGVDFVGIQLPPIHPVITGAIGFPDDHPHLEHFRFLASVTSVTAKISIPGPSVCHYRTAPGDVQPKAYADREVLTADIAKTYKKAVKAFYEAGCRYLQMDDIYFAYLCDPAQRAAKEAEGHDPDWLIDRYAWMIHEAIKDRPADMIIGMHMCRGNFRSTHAAAGGYDPAADAIFNQTGVDVFFMEYDTERAGGLEPLRLLPKGPQRVLPGFITTKHGGLEDLDSLRRRFDDAAQYTDVAQLGIAPQCGFASTDDGNEISAAEQRRKLELVIQTAQAIWGSVA